MIRRNSIITLAAMLIWLAGNISMTAGAENHALLIGIGKYKQRTLEGPPFDVAALAEMLGDHYDFAKKKYPYSCK